MSKSLKACLLAALLAVPAAGQAGNYGQSPAMGAGGSAAASQKPQTYGQAVGEKLGAGVLNIALSPLEVHKNIVNTTNETNLALGITGGVAKGALHMVGRMMAGLVDVVSFPLPTETLTVPKYVWEDYNVETHYTVPLLKMKKLQ
jgi:putative exosortase-associated protein (TIGR04073 family)